MEIFISIVGIFASLFAVYKIVVDVVMAKSSNRREEYQFAKDYYLDLNNEETPAFVLERGFLALTGYSYPVPEIKYLLSFDKPGQMIKYRSKAGSFVEFTSDPAAYSWKGKYKRKVVRNLASWLYLALYIALASVALFPIYSKDIDAFDGITAIIFSVSLGVTAIACLISHEDFKNAKEFMKSKKG